MKKQKISVLIIALFAFCSCNKDALEKSSTSNPTQDGHKTEEWKLVSKRTGTKDVILSSKKASSIKNFALPGPLLLEEYLGRSYRGDANIITAPENVGFKVIDIERLLQDHPDYYRSINLDAISATSSSFSSFDRYEQKTNSNKTITGGFSLNLGLFSFGAKNKWTSVFSSTVINENNRVFGELNVEVKGLSYSLLSTSNVRNNIIQNYLNPTFLDELNNSSRGEFIQNFGAFVLADYYTGGKATAMYTGKDERNTTSENKEKAMDGSINASFGFTVKKDGDGKVGGDFGFANGSKNSTDEQHNITQLNLAIKTIGGDKGLGAFTVPKKIEDININLGEWVSSLNDRSKHNLIGINENGLNPISDFVLEENFKQAIKTYVQDPQRILSSSSKLYTPVILITEREVQESPYVFTYLYTRFGDRIDISQSNSVSQSLTDELLAQRIAAKKPFFDLDYYRNDFDNPASNVDLPFYSPSYISLTGINEGTMKKFYYDKTKTTYLLYSGGGKKYALSIHDDYILDTYGIRNWVTSMPTTTVSFSELQTYTIIGL